MNPLSITQKLVFPVLLFFVSGCTNLFFFPAAQHVLVPSDVGLEFEDVYLSASDGAKLHAWFLPAKGEAKGSVLFLHGNAENISTHLGSVYWLPAEGYSVLLLDYRGYGKSQGAANLKGALLDVEAGLSYLTERVSAGVLVFGQSLGGALAVSAVSASRYRQHVRGLIVESAFASYRRIFREKLGQFWLFYPLSFPLAYGVRDDLSPERAVAELAGTPILFVHGDEDQTVPLEHSKTLYRLAKEPKALWVIKGGRHIAAFEDEQLRQKLLAEVVKW